MLSSIGLLSENQELIDQFKKNLKDYQVKNYKSIDYLKPEEMLSLAVDPEFFKSSEDIQFHLSRIRKKLHEMPVLLIISAGTAINLDFEWFFDEFILYPFRISELSIRIRRLLWVKNILPDENTISIGNIKVNLKEYLVYINNERQEFTYKEFELLRLFIENRGVVFSRKELLNRIWGMDYIGGTRTVDVHIRRLRSKLGEEFNTIIETVRNVGYKCRS